MKKAQRFLKQISRSFIKAQKFGKKLAIIFVLKYNPDKEKNHEKTIKKLDFVLLNVHVTNVYVIFGTCTEIRFEKELTVSKEDDAILGEREHFM